MASDAAFCRMVYYVDSQLTPYMVRIPASAAITLGMVKDALGFDSESDRFFFKSVDAEIGEVREEVSGDLEAVPSVVDGGARKIVCWVRRGKTALLGDTSSLASSHSFSDSSSIMTSSTASSMPRRVVHRRRRKHRGGGGGASSSIASSTLSLNIVTVTLDLSVTRFLGISIMSGSGVDDGPPRYAVTEGGVYIGSVVEGGAVAEDGRIEIGDMILQVNEHSLENITNDEAIRLLRDAVNHGRFIKLVVAKKWDALPRRNTNKNNPFESVVQKPVQPIDPSAWAATQASLSNAANNPVLENGLILSQTI